VSTVLLCIGNPFRRDDGVAAAVADRARRTLPVTPRIPARHIIECDGEPARLVEAWRDAELAIIVDASRSDLPAGAIRRIDVGLDGDVDAGIGAGLPTTQSTSTHGWSVGDAVELGRVLNRLPRRLVVYSVEGDDFGEGIGLSAPVGRAVDDVVRRVAREMSELPPSDRDQTS
jgi:hydrogenase maturation protease